MQRSYDDPTTPLHRVTFCVLDLETTGGSPHADAITEIGAVKVRGGEIIGTFQTLVNPGLSVPGPVTVLTGITDTMLAPAPPVHEVLPALSEFVGGAVLVGHNVRFDASFLDAALVAHGRPVLGIHRVDTAALARRLLRNDDDVLNCKLGTLAVRYGLDHDPCHRALDDALATVDLLHLLLERAAAFGVSALDDLLTLPSMAGHPHAHKLRLTSRLPRQPGVYLFRDRQGRPLHLGRATDLRTRVRSLFASDDGRTIRPLLRTAHSLDHVVCSSALEAGVLEARLLARLAPRFNRHGTRWRSYRYVGLGRGRFPRPTVVRAPSSAPASTPRPGDVHLGPLVSARAARAVVEAIEAAVPLPRDPTDPAEHGRLVERITRGLRDRPASLLGPLDEQIARLRADHRYAAATALAERRSVLARALRRQRRFASLRQAGHVIVELPGGAGAELVRGRLLRAWGPGGSCADPPAPLPGAGDLVGEVAEVVEPPPADGPIPAELADELHYVAAWLDRHADHVRLVEVDGRFDCPLPALPRPAGPAADLLSVPC